MSEIDERELKHIIEALLYVAEEPLNIAAMMSVFEGEYEDPRVFRSKLVSALEELAEDCQTRGVELVQVASGYRLQVDKEHSDWVRRLSNRNPPRYSRALLETLAMVAYRQPVTRAQIEEVRGVKTSGNILRALRDRGWVRELGRKQVPGLPIQYGTTRSFLDYFNLRSLADLPPFEEYEMVLQEEEEAPPQIVAEDDSSS